MNNKLTINRSFHVKTRRNGSKSMEDGKAPSSPEGRIPRITRLLALSHRCYDFHATVLHLMGIDHKRLVYRQNGIDRRLTDVHGNVVNEILA